jgi:spermidine/putrescine-binding protein
VTLTHIAHGGSTQNAEEEMMEQWAEQHDDDISIQGQSVSNNIEVMSTISENPSEYDFSSVIATNGVAIHDLQFEGGIFTEVDLDQVPNYTENVQEQWRSEDNPLMIDNPWGIKHYINSQGMAYDADEVDDPTSWDACKTEAVRGDVAHFDAGLTRFVNSATAAGIDAVEALQEGNDDLYEQVWDEAREQDEYVGTYWGTGDEFMRLYREDSAIIGSGWGGRVRVLQQDDLNVKYTIPEEGAYPGGTCWCIVDESENKDYVYEFLNWLYQRENAIELSTEGHGYPIPLKDPPEEITQLPDYIESPEQVTNINIRNVIPHVQRLAQDWAELKA